MRCCLLPKISLGLAQDGIEHYQTSLQDINGYQTLRVTGYCRQRGLNILIDSRLTHNFVENSLAGQDGLEN